MAKATIHEGQVLLVMSMEEADVVANLVALGNVDSPSNEVYEEMSDAMGKHHRLRKITNCGFDEAVNEDLVLTVTNESY